MLSAIAAPLSAQAVAGSFVYCGIPASTDSALRRIDAGDLMPRTIVNLAPVSSKLIS